MGACLSVADTGAGAGAGASASASAACVGFGFGFVDGVLSKVFFVVEQVSDFERKS